MPTKKCVQFGSKLYCYNKEDNSVSVYREQKFDLNECPENVISAFIQNKYDVNIVIDEKDKLSRRRI